MKTLLAAVPLLFLVWSGCSEPETASIDAVETSEGTEPVAGTDAEFLTYPFIQHGMTEKWVNGTFSITDHRFPVGGLIGELTGSRPYRRPVDVTADIPPGGPVLVSLVYGANVQGGGWPEGGDLDININGEQEDILAASFNTPYGGHGEVDVWVQTLTGKPIEIILVYDEVDPSASIDYSIHFMFHAMPRLLPPGVATAVKLNAGDELGVEAMGDAADLMVWDPRDRLVGRYHAAPRANITIPADATPGEFVLLPSQTGSGVRIQAPNATTNRLRALPFEWIGGTPQSLNPGAEARWNVEVERPPIALGIWIYNREGPFLCPQFDAAVTDPNQATLFEVTWAEPRCGGVSPVMGFGYWDQTIHGHERVLPGTYGFHVKSDQTANLEAQDWFMYYVR